MNQSRIIRSRSFILHFLPFRIQSTTLAVTHITNVSRDQLGQQSLTSFLRTNEPFFQQEVRNFSKKNGHQLKGAGLSISYCLETLCTVTNGKTIANYRKSELITLTGARGLQLLFQLWVSICAPNVSPPLIFFSH